jgi:transcription-repair coupling factor (superfamily II helicase)
MKRPPTSVGRASPCALGEIMPRNWLKTIIDDPAVVRLSELLAPGRRVAAEGAWGSAAHLLGGAMAIRTGNPLLLVVAHLDDADEALEDLALIDGVEAVVFPALEVLPGESNVSLEQLADRLSLVSRLSSGSQPTAIIAPIQALMQSVPRADAVKAMTMDLRAGQALDPAKLTAWLDNAGYRRSDAIEEVGDFAVRGGIVDIYGPPTSANTEAAPIRLDFFGDQLEEISLIDPETMASNKKIDAARLIGASADKLQQGDGAASLWSMLSSKTVVVLSELLEIDEQARGYYERLHNPVGIFPPAAVHRGLDAFSVVQVNQFAAPGMAETRVQLPVQVLPPFDSDAAKAVAELGEAAVRHRVVVTCLRQAEADRLKELIAEHTPAAVDRIAIELGYLFRGFLWGIGPEPFPIKKSKTDTRATGKSGPTPNELGAGSQKPLLLVPHHELLHRYHTRRRIRRIGGGRAMETFLDIEVGDYVVHSQHGIAVFRGMRLMRRGDKDEGEIGEEYLTLEFADKAKLHVPASQIEFVHKYVGGFSGRPPLSKLGGTRWKKQKEAAEVAAKDLAAELLRVHAARQAMPGFRYAADTLWMKQFEAEFPYEETDDQLAAMVELKKDMSSGRPMDRLICGDVGYGKTELAMRAAFKAVEAGKQVAVLCPTTVLCEQHERTFRERIADYPFRIGALNRFKSPQEVREVVDHLHDGQVDLVIGTHRLLSQDVAFKDLGLVIVDEEQKFGVEHKNKLMRFRVTVDVLTLSATPIPRTLHMALLGLRDISSLSTPPADRRAVVTEVTPHDPVRIRSAILRELNRNGQCFFVHNRVQSIRAVAMEIGALVPEARVGVGHGQMAGHELEEVMLRFVRGEIDVLVCTTIIESGIDIPTANTILIADCDRFGLAELHQLRGRVGRYKHRAYCYLLLPKERPVSEVASRRLRAIEEFSMLGAGFKIAMRDMEIRGVGNILGKEQSGHIAVIGYELYCRLLEQATAALKREVQPDTTATHLNLRIAGHLPKRYMPSDKHRMEAYRRIGRATDMESLRKTEADLRDAYGEVPAAAQTLLALAEIRLALASLRVVSLKLEGPDLIFTTHHIQRLSPLLARAPGSVRVVDTPTADKPGTIFYRPPANYIEEPATLLAVLRKLLVAPVERGLAAV